MNVKANGLLASREDVNDFVPISPGDESNPNRRMLLCN